ncbi:MAG: hypothetical protein NC408_04450 [Candidatus Gastranaerophilales bacterium]|nr:hypothetical protein [Candidatus Gastranaerophilales bacterium]MCM1072278.1 hypothetical protein [Bacteroides sp.]
MAYLIEPLIYEKFRGIREYNGVNAGGEISAIACNNVELVQTEIGANTGIKSMNGNITAYNIPVGYSIKGIFASQQDDRVYKLIYAEGAPETPESEEQEKKGVLFYINLADQPEIIIDNLTPTGQCNGLTMSSSAFDVFVFTNGVEAKTVCFTLDEAYKNSIQNYNPVDIGVGYVADIVAEDYLGRKVKWLSMTEWNGFLVVASEYGVHASHQNDIYLWNENPQDLADAWYIDFSKKITAVFAFTGGLYIFTDTDCTLLNTTPNDTTNSVMKTSAGIGCYSYQSIVKHDLYLFFYDNNQKNIYYLSATDTTGQIKPAGPVAKEIQSYFSDIKSFKMYSCIYNTRNEIWCLIDKNILIYDYAQNEWVTRQEQDLNSLALIENTIFSGGTNNNVYVESENIDYSGQFFPSVYKTTYINAGSNSNLKKQKTPLLITLNTDYVNDFWVQLTINNKAKNPKRVKVYQSRQGVYGPEDDNVEPLPINIFGIARYSEEKTYQKTVVEISTPQTWYTLGVKIFTDTMGQGFYIQSMELKNIKMKTKTKGR